MKSSLCFLSVLWGAGAVVNVLAFLGCRSPINAVCFAVCAFMSVFRGYEAWKERAS